jgi:hypothetical protein
MSGPQQPWTVPVAGVLVLLAASIGGIAAASDPGTRQIGLPGAGLAALIGLGLLARRRWALWAGFALIPISAALTVAAFKADADTDDAQAGRMMAWVTIILLLLLLPALPTLRRRPSRRAAAGRASGAPTQPAPTQPAPTQPAPLARPPTFGQRLLFGLFALPTVVVGMALFLIVLLGLASGSTSPGTILVLAAILLFFGSCMVMFRPRQRVLTFDLARLSIDGASSQAFLARYDRLGRAAAPAALTSAAIIGTCVLIKAHRPAAIWLPVAILTALATIGLLVLLTTGWRSYVALAPSGLYVPGPRRPTLVPWAAVQDGYLNLVPHYGGAEQFVAISVSDPAAIKTSPVGRLLRLVNHGYGGDLQFPARLLATEPEFLVHAIDVYRSNPDRQQAIGTVDELDRLRGEWTGQVRR